MNEISQNTNLAINSLVPTTRDPIGAPRPLLRHRVAESHDCTSRAGLIPRATEALTNRAPSMCNSKFISLHRAPSFG